MEDIKNNISKIVKFFEIASFLHDIGKISSHFIMSKDPDLKIKDHHAMLILEENLPENLKIFLMTPINQIFKNLENLENNLSPIHFICAHHGCDRCIYNNNCAKLDKNFYIKLLQIADRYDSSNPPNSGKQSFYNTYLSNFFLIEKRVDYKKLDILRKNYLNLLDTVILNLDREKIYSLSLFFMQDIISETRRGANDINLYSHSKAVSSIFKSILFDYFYFKIEPPKNIFDIELKYLRSKKGYKNLIEEKIGFGNLIFSIDNIEYYLISKNIDSLFLKINNIKGEILDKIEIEKTERKYLYPLNPDKILSTMLVKTPDDIDLKFSDVLIQTKKLINFAKYSEIKELSLKIKGIRKHIKNLKKGNKFHEIKIKRNLLEKLKRRLYYLKKNYENNFDIKEIENFLMKSLAPIRPPSIVNFSKYLIETMKSKKLNINELTFEVFLKKPLTISRIIQYNMDIKKFKNIDKLPKFYGKLKLSNKKVLESYKSVENIKLEKNKVTLTIGKKNYTFPVFYNGEEIDKLTQYFICKTDRVSENIYPLGRGKSLVHITQLKKGERIKFIT